MWIQIWTALITLLTVEISPKSISKYGWSLSNLIGSSKNELFVCKDFLTECT
ncbi:MAG: hypothetical protein M5U17_17365 [Ignavibacterium sp.]|nr:hypothetical protein [Ignavibacterium sp.]